MHTFFLVAHAAPPYGMAWHGMPLILWDSLCLLLFYTIVVKVKPSSKQNLVECIGENQYTVRVKEKALEGRANEAVIKLLSKYFDVPKNRILVVVGLKNKNKIIDIA